MPKSRRIKTGRRRRRTIVSRRVAVGVRTQGPSPGVRQGTVHTFTRWTGSDLLTLTATAGTLGSINLNNSGMLTLTTTAVQAVSFYAMSLGFCLGDVPSVSEFTNLFERYRLDRVDIRLTPLYTVCAAPLAAGNGGIGGFLHTTTDYNDYGVLAASQAGINSIRERDSYRTVNITNARTYSWSVRPRVAISAYAGGAFSGYSNQQAPWCDTVSTNVEHYGVKWIFEVANTLAAIQYCNFKLELRYHLSFCDVK